MEKKPQDISTHIYVISNVGISENVHRFKCRLQLYESKELSFESEGIMI